MTYSWQEAYIFIFILDALFAQVCVCVRACAYEPFYQPSLVFDAADKKSRVYVFVYACMYEPKGLL